MAQDGDSVEFGQLPQEELPALTAYVQRQGLPLGAPADEESDADEGGTSGELNAKGSAAASKEDAHSGDSDAISDEEVCSASSRPSTTSVAGFDPDLMLTHQ